MNQEERFSFRRAFIEVAKDLNVFTNEEMNNIFGGITADKPVPKGYTEQEQYFINKAIINAVFDRHESNIVQKSLVLSPEIKVQSFVKAIKSQLEVYNLLNPENPITADDLLMKKEK